MYGLVNKSIEELVVRNFGEERWETVKARAGLDVDVFITNESYPDEMTYQLVDAASEVLDLTNDQILIAFGEHWVLNTATNSYGPMMKAGGKTLKEFLVNLPNFHTRVSVIFPELHPPRFECTDVTDRSLKLHYYSLCPNLTAFVVGLVQGLGKMFETPATTRLIESAAHGAHHDIFEVQWLDPA